MPEDSWELEDWRKHGTNLEASRGEEGSLSHNGPESP